MIQWISILLNNLTTINNKLFYFEKKITIIKRVEIEG